MNTENKQNTEKSAGGNAASTQPAKDQNQAASNPNQAANSQNQAANSQKQPAANNQSADNQKSNGGQTAPNADELAEQAKKAVSEEAGKVTEQVGKVLSGDTGAIKDVIGQVKESGGNLAGKAVGQAKETASTLINERKSNLASGLGSIAETIRKVGGDLRETDGTAHGIADKTATYGDSLANRVEEVSDYLENKNVGEIFRDVETFARRNPAVFVAAAFVVGIAAGRFLKATNPNPTQHLTESGKITQNSAAGKS